MTPKYLEELADAVDPGKLWQRDFFALLTDQERQQRDAGCALRRYADLLRCAQQLRRHDQSLCITWLSENSTATGGIPTPAKHRPHIWKAGR